MGEKFKRISPEEALNKVLKENRGHLKIFLGYAPGVGKTYSMLNEANRRLESGEDIVIGYVEAHGRRETEAQVGKLQVIPRKKLEYNGRILEEMDVQGVIRRHPRYVIIDELAHTNVPGSKNRKRYEDVEEILKQGINVISTLNMQHLESYNDVVREITGVEVRETIPDRIVEEADEVEVIDLSPEALQDRLKKGLVYSRDNVDRALRNFFRKGNLNALREITLRHTAEEVDDELEEYMKAHGMKEKWHTVERVMVCISPSPFAKRLIRRGARISRRYKCHWVVASVECTNIFASDDSEGDRNRLEHHFELARELGAEIVKLKGKSISRELARYATATNVTQLIIGHSRRSRIQTILRGSTITKLLKNTKNIEVHIIPVNH